MPRYIYDWDATGYPEKHIWTLKFCSCISIKTMMFSHCKNGPDKGFNFGYLMVTIYLTTWFHKLYLHQFMTNHPNVLEHDTYRVNFSFKNIFDVILEFIHSVLHIRLDTKWARCMGYKFFPRNTNDNTFLEL